MFVANREPSSKPTTKGEGRRMQCIHVRWHKCKLVFKYQIAQWRIHFTNLPHELCLILYSKVCNLSPIIFCWWNQQEICPFSTTVCVLCAQKSSIVRCHSLATSFILTSVGRFDCHILLSDIDYVCISGSGPGTLLALFLFQAVACQIGRKIMIGQLYLNP